MTVASPRFHQSLKSAVGEAQFVRLERPAANLLRPVSRLLYCTEHDLKEV